MDPNELKLRNVLIDIDHKLSVNDRHMLSFLLDADVPRRDLDAIADNHRTPMNIIWEALISRQKITPDNVDYLIVRLDEIGRKDLARTLKEYSATARSNNRNEPLNNASNLFNRINP
ncbi:unnamed protein product [Adineta steineri]|uniref:DED domain-containing protein n=1 Tax=Adineta steineri TaxID=433720 RepID=A0A818VJN4_9BILA|nr:unnamed protein product [Adineta steineri]